MNAALSIKLHKNQDIIHRSQARFKVVKAGRRFGKTNLALFELLKAAGQYPGETFWYIAPTYRMAKDIAWDDLKRMIPAFMVRKRYETELTIFLAHSNSKIQLKGADNEDSLRGTRLKGIVLDEAALVKQSLWTDILRGQLADSCGFAYFISTPKGRNWFTQMFEEAGRKKHMGDTEWDAFYFTTLDNPLLDRKELDKIKEESSDSTWQQEFMAVELENAGQKYSEFDFKRNVEERETGKDVYLGLDWGLNHPTVCLWAHIEKDTVYITDEYWRSGLTIQEHCTNIREKNGAGNIVWSVIDPSANKRDPSTMRSLKDEYARWGLYCLDGDRRERGTDIVKRFLKRGLVKIHPRCRNLIRELQILQWGDKEGDDATDALRYLLVELHDRLFGGNLFTEPETALRTQTREWNMKDFDKPADEISWLLEEVA